jgi:zinc protease
MAKKFQLKNGLKVLLLESHKSPVVSVQMWVRTGSADERKGEEGISHFIEHLVFKGTRKFGVGEIAATVEGSGGELNAYTSFDQTVFYVTISKEFVDQGLQVISEMMGHPLFDEAEINNEREVVIEEIKRGQDSPQRRASQLLFSTAFKKHPYGIPVIGYEKIIRKVNPKVLKKYFADRYSPKNMFLVVSGDFTAADMKPKILNYFSDFKSTPVRKVKRVKDTPQKKANIELERSDFKETQMYFSWKIPNVKHKDIPALDVLAFVLGQGDSSRLVKALRMDKALATSVGASSFTPQDEGLFTVFVSMDPKNLSEAIFEMKKTLIQFLQNGPTAEEMQKAVNCFASEQVYSIETVDGIARKAGSLEFYMGDPNYFTKYLKEVGQLKSEDILKVARKYLDPKKMNISALTDQEIKKTKTEAQNLVKSYSQEYALAKKPAVKQKGKNKALVLKPGNPAAAPDTQKIILPNGMKVLLRQQKDTPTFSLKMAFLGGLRHEPEGKDGMTELLARTWTAGSAKYSEDEINERIDSLAAGISSFGGRNTIGMNLDGLSAFQNELSEIFFDVLENPTWDSGILEREKTVLLQQIKSRNDNPAQVCINQFTKNMFKDHVYGRDMLGTEKSVASIRREDIKSFFQSMMVSGGATVCLVGDFDKDLWMGKIKTFSEKLSYKTMSIRSPKVSEIKSDSRHFSKLEKEQTHIVLGYRGLTLKSEERYALHIIQSILAGQGGRLFFELRDKNSLAYSVSPVRMEGIDTGYFGAYIGCSPEKTDKAISMLKEEFKKLCDVKVPTAELERAQRYLVGRHDIDLQRKSSVCAAFLFDEIYGIDYSEVFEANKKYFAVTVDEVQKLSQKIFQQPAVISIVGPEPAANL